MFDEIENRLWDVNADRLKKYATVVGAERKSRKADVIKAIMEKFNDTFVDDNYKNLNEYEKSLIDNFIQQKSNPTASSVEEIDRKYKNKLSLTKTYNKFFLPISWKQFYMPKVFKEALESLVPKRVISFNESKPNDKESYYAYIIDRQSRVTDFDYFIKYINSNKVKPTAKNRSLAKKDLIKIYNELNYNDIIRDKNSLNVSDIKRIEDTTVSFGIFKLLTLSNVINDKHEYFTLGKASNEFVKLNKIDKVKVLLNGYINSNINEIERITAALIKTESNPDLELSREYLIDMLKKLPINKWVSGEDFKKEVRMDNYKFIRKNLSSCLVRDDYYNSYYNSPEFYQLECPFIDIFLSEYMSVLGIVDVLVTNTYTDDWSEREYNEVSYLRLTDFGAIVLGLKESESVALEDTGFIVDDDLNIEVLDGLKKMEYELYFERFLERKDNKYVLNFEGIARALDLGLDLKEIIIYINKYGKNISEGVNYILNKWLDNSDKIKIKTVSIVEYPIELSNLFNKKTILNNIEHGKREYLIIKKGKNKNIKKMIEKEEYYCTEE